MNLKELRELNLKLTKKKIKESVTEDFLIIQVIHTIDELIKILNRLIENLRERYSYYSLSVSKIEDLNEFLNAVKKKEIDKELAIENKEDLETILGLVNLAEGLIKVKEKQEKYLEELTEMCCKNLKDITGTLIASRLIAIAKSLKRLAELPSSTIQILGAEKALFRHLRTGARPPRFGIIFSHEEITKAENKGRAARRLASKISLAAKKDYFR